MRAVALGPDVGVVVVAAGLGRRLGASIRKALVPLGGQPMVLRAVESVRGPGPLVVVAHPDDLEALAGLFPGDRVVAGGARRQDSVAAGLAALPALAEFVLVHDAARPFVRRAVVEAVVAEARRVGAALAAEPVRDTLKEAGPEGRVLRTVPRGPLWAAQTPQGFRRTLLEEAHRRLAEEGAEVTDDAQAVERLGQPVALVASDSGNRKLTTGADLEWAAWVLGRDGTGRVQ